MWEQRCSCPSPFCQMVLPLCRNDMVKIIYITLFTIALKISTLKLQFLELSISFVYTLFSSLYFCQNKAPATWGLEENCLLVSAHAIN